MPTIYAWMAAIGILGAAGRSAPTRRRKKLLDQHGKGLRRRAGHRDGGRDVRDEPPARSLASSTTCRASRSGSRARELPAAFLAAWDALIHRFGVRGPNEMELASPALRRGPHPAAYCGSCRSWPGPTPENEPKLAHELHVAERREAFADAQRAFWAGSGAALLRLAHRWTEAYAGERDTAKYHWVTWPPTRCDAQRARPGRPAWWRPGASTPLRRRVPPHL